MPSETNSPYQANEVQYFSHTLIAPFRSEDIPTKVKEFGVKTQEAAVFKKSDSVFREWKENNAFTLQLSCAHDQMKWKLDKFIKDNDE